MSGTRSSDVASDAKLTDANSDRFHTGRPGDLRAPPPWHRLAYIARSLPAALARIVGELDLSDDIRVLDFGCAEMPYRHLFPPGVDFVGADLPGNPWATETISAGRIAGIEDSSVDMVLSTQVLEHVRDPRIYLAECRRVLRPGGILVLSTHGLMVYHADPIDFWRWTSAGLREELQQVGFSIDHFEGIMGLAATGLQMVLDAIYYRLPVGLRAPAAFVAQTLIALFDRIEKPESRDIDAMVFAVVARSPQTSVP